MEMKLNKSDWIFLILCLVLGITAEEAFFRDQIGISYLVFIFIFYAVFFWRFRGFSFSHQRFGYLILICIWLLASSFFIHTNQFFYGLNLLVIPGLVIFHLVLVTSQKRLSWNKPVFLRYLFSRLIESVKYNAVLASVLGKIFKQGLNEDKYIIWKKILIGLFISIPVFLVVLPLLMSADTQFERMMGDIPQLFQIIDVESFIRVIVVLIYTLAFFGLMQVLLKKQIKAIMNKDNSTSFKMDAIISITVLVLMNAVYLLFTIVQFKYFFSGSLQGDLTYAEYARKGFFELLFVTLINLSITVLVLNFVDRNVRRTKRLTQILLTVLVLSSAVMLSSAFMRLSMYEDAYGFTFIRVMAHSFMIFLVVIYVYTLFKIWIEKLSLFHFYFISALLYYAAMNMLDVEKMVVTNNIDRYEQTGKIDPYYFNNLSYSGDIGLVELYEKDKEIPGLKDLIKERKMALDADRSSWRSYNLKRELAKEKLRGLELE
ncbi:DUF4153 domain-containing protein [Bacillus sp. 1NLA3E]|uniref:DUF4153 domain-containing protein n=1 Tax=Bacillus sp. 1NLA3E TaxID=666686 RepID=UPI000247F046|nr:DUF4173 domain-containing protein [Bacillus sp. 1NLA3E]